MEIQSSGAQKRKDYFAPALFAGAFVFFAFLMWCTPYSSDDLEFAHLGFSTVREYVHFALYYGNGRFLGNLCAIVLSNSRVLCVLIKSVVMASMVLLMPEVLELRSRSSYLLSFLLITAMAPPVFGEAIMWTSGFGNYVPPIWLSMLIILMIRHYSSAKLPLKVVIWLAVPVLGTASQLFIEHSSGVNGLLAFCFLVSCLRKGKKPEAALCGLWLLAAAAGMGTMFLIPKLFYRAGNRVEGYQNTHLSSITAMIVGSAKTAVHLLNYYFGSCEIPLCFGAAATVMKTRQKRSEKANRTLLGLVALAAMYLCFALLASAVGYYGKSAIIQSVLSGGSVLLPLGVWIFAALKLEPELRCKQLFLLGFAVISMIPLLVVSPTPPRVILQSYIFVMLAALHCFEWTGLGRRKGAQNLLLTACLCVSVLLGSVFFSIRDMSAARDAYIRQEVAGGSKEIEIFVLPYQYTTWDHLWTFAFTYTDGSDIVFDDVDFHSWMNSHYN